jgi:hypothetical protein
LRGDDFWLGRVRGHARADVPDLSRPAAPNSLCGTARLAAALGRVDAGGAGSSDRGCAEYHLQVGTRQSKAPARDARAAPCSLGTRRESQALTAFGRRESIAGRVPALPTGSRPIRGRSTSCPFPTRSVEREFARNDWPASLTLRVSLQY